MLRPSPPHRPRPTPVLAVSSVSTALAAACRRARPLLGFLFLAVPFLLILTTAIILSACQGAGAAQPGAGASPSPELAVSRGDLTERIVLSGELDAAESAEITVPATNQGALSLRWLAEEGAAVAAGAPVAEFDNLTFIAQRDEKSLASAQARDELTRAEVEAADAEAEKAFTVEQRRAEVAKARLAARIPEGIVAERERQERQLAVERSEVQLAQAEADLAAHRRASAADLASRRIALGKLEREVADAEQTIAALVVRAPRAGLVVVAEPFGDGRKAREGDNLWSGTTVARIPDLDTLEVQARLSDVDDGRVLPGQRAVCTLDAYPGAPFGARVVDVSPVAHEAPRSAMLRMFTVRLAPDRRDPVRMRPGMSVKVEIAGRTARGALLAPRAALDLGGDPGSPDGAGDRPQPRALLAGGGAAPVRLGPCDALRCAVEGLSEGTRLRSRERFGGGSGA